MRIYAIGDIHGCKPRLDDLHAMIADDLVRAPAAEHRIIHLGDLVDRGPESSDVVELLATLTAADRHVVTLTGNHDAIFMEFLARQPGRAESFLQFGGAETLRSYGCKVGIDPDWSQLAGEARARVPEHHVAFLRALPRFLRLGDYAFCHAGIRPGVPLADQHPDDLIWIRGDFLHDTREHEAVIVHGHTPANPVEVMPNRINVDTGAVFGGPLTCVVLEDTDHRFLQA